MCVQSAKTEMCNTRPADYTKKALGMNQKLHAQDLHHKNVMGIYCVIIAAPIAHRSYQTLFEEFTPLQSHCRQETVIVKSVSGLLPENVAKVAWALPGRDVFG